VPPRQRPANADDNTIKRRALTNPTSISVDPSANPARNRRTYGRAHQAVRATEAQPPGAIA